MMFLCCTKNPFYGFFSFAVDIFHSQCMSDILTGIQIFLPYMSCYYFDMALALCTFGTDKDSRHICFRHSCILCNPLCLSWNILISHSQDRCNSHSIHHTHIHIFLRIRPLSLVFCTETKALSHHPSRVLRLPVSCSLHPLPVFLCDISLTFHRLQEMFYCHVHFRDARCSQVSNHFHHRLFLSHRRILLYVRLYETSHFPGPFHSLLFLPFFHRRSRVTIVILVIVIF